MQSANSSRVQSTLHTYIDPSSFRTAIGLLPVILGVQPVAWRRSIRCAEFQTNSQKQSYSSIFVIAHRSVLERSGLVAKNRSTFPLAVTTSMGPIGIIPHAQSLNTNSGVLMSAHSRSSVAWRRVAFGRSNRFTAAALSVSVGKRQYASKDS